MHVGAGGDQKEVLSPLVEGDAPRIRDVGLHGSLQPLPLGVVAEKSAVDAANGAVGGFHVGMMEKAFAHKKGAGRIGAKGAGGVVRVVGVKTGQHNLPGIGSSIAILVAKKDQVGRLGNINAFRRQFKADRHVEFVGIDGAFVGFAVAVGVFQN